MKRSNKAQILQQREVVMQLLLSGASRAYILQAVAAKFSLSNRTIDKLLADCYKLFKEEHAKQFKDKIAEYDAKLNFLYERAVTQNDLHIAFKIIEHLKQSIAQLNSNSETQSDDKPIDIFSLVKNDK